MSSIALWPSVIMTYRSLDLNLEVDKDGRVVAGVESMSTNEAVLGPPDVTEREGSLKSKSQSIAERKAWDEKQGVKQN
jgi:hypothetical protein